MLALKSWKRQVLLALQDLPATARVELFRHLISTAVVWVFQFSFSFRIILRNVALGVIGISSPDMLELSWSHPVLIRFCGIKQNRNSYRNSKTIVRQKLIKRSSWLFILDFMAVVVSFLPVVWFQVVQWDMSSAYVDIFISFLGWGSPRITMKSKGLVGAWRRSLIERIGCWWIRYSGWKFSSRPRKEAQESRIFFLLFLFGCWGFERNPKKVLIKTETGKPNPIRV